MSCSTAASLSELIATATTTPSTSLLVLLPSPSTNFTKEAGDNKTLFVVYGQVGFGVGFTQEAGSNKTLIMVYGQVGFGVTWGYFGVLVRFDLGGPLVMMPVYALLFRYGDNLLFTGIY